jgi:hypothetical protein
MDDNLLQLEKALSLPDPNKAARLSVQSRAEASNGFAPTTDVMGGGVFWLTLGQRLEEEPRWNPIYPNFRDRFLTEFGRSESMMASAIYSMGTRIGTLNYTLNGPPRIKKFTQELLNKPGLGDNFAAITKKLSYDLDTTDNGAFMELWKAGSPEKAPPKNAPCLGFGHLDSRLCWRSFDPEFPVWYTNPVTGVIRKLHKDRVVFSANNPQPIELARGIGFCAVSRAMRMVRVFKNMQIFVDEKVSGRFTRALGAISGVSAGQVKKALQNHADEMDNKGYVVYNDIPFLIDPSTEGKNDIKILLQDLATVPDGFSFRDDADLYAYILAFCFGVDAREFWPATQSGATKADATVQNMKARGRGIGDRIQMVEFFIRAAIAEVVDFEYDFSDDDQDKMQAEIQGMRLNNLSTLQRGGALNSLEMRALAIAEGIIDGALLETLNLPVDSDSSLADQEDDQDSLESNTGNSETPTDGAVEQTSVGKALTVKTQAAYRRSLRQFVRGYWNGELGAFDFFDGFANTIERNFTKAWYDGAAQWGIAPNEITDEEKTRLRLEINTEITFISGFADAIQNGSKANGGQLAPLYDRLEMWVNAYDRIMSLAGQLAAADAKGIWVYGDTIDHCASCSTYAGRVYRNSVWVKWLEPYDLLPHGGGLACKGFRCECSIKKTSEPVSSGRPPIVTKVHTHDPIKAHGNYPATHTENSRIHQSNRAGRSQDNDPGTAGLRVYTTHLEKEGQV